MDCSPSSKLLETRNCDEEGSKGASPDTATVPTSSCLGGGSDSPAPYQTPLRASVVEIHRDPHCHVSSASEEGDQYPFGRGEDDGEPVHPHIGFNTDLEIQTSAQSANPPAT